MKNAVPQNSTTVRLPFSPELMTTALRLAPWLQKPVLTRLFLTPLRKNRSRSAPSGTQVGTIEVGHRRLIVRARGKGPTVMMVHGWQGHAGHFSTLSARLIDAGYTVVSFDMPAHGESSGTTTSLPEFVQAIFEVAKLVGPVHSIVAHSLGATAASIALARGQSVQSAALIAPMISFDFALDEFSKMLHLDKKLREATATGTEERVGITRAEADLNRLTLPDIPLIVFHDTKDVRTPYRYSQDLQRSWPQMKLVTTTGFGHKQILHSPEVGRGITAFVADTPARDSNPLDLGVIPELTY